MRGHSGTPFEYILVPVRYSKYILYVTAGTNDHKKRKRGCRFKRVTGTRNGHHNETRVRPQPRQQRRNGEQKRSKSSGRYALAAEFISRAYMAGLSVCQ